VSRTAITVFAALATASIGWLLPAACGRVEDSPRSDAATAPPSATPTGGRTGPGVPTGEPLDASPRDAAHLDGGPAPTYPCADAAPELRCPLPPSFCIDDHWMRYYGSATCDEATGQCVATSIDIECVKTEAPPDCFMGGCRATVVR